jgi:hypothetical protein
VSLYTTKEQYAEPPVPPLSPVVKLSAGWKTMCLNFVSFLGAPRQPRSALIMKVCESQAGVLQIEIKCASKCGKAFELEILI